MKIRCPAGTHEDNTPSCKVYPDGSGFCFSCSTYFKEIENADSNVNIPLVISEDLESKGQYIRALPTMQHRGLLFHYDSNGYYVLFPGTSYYKCRLWAPSTASNKYLSPKGHKKPVFYIPSFNSKLIIVEGEINALSLSQIPSLGYDILSPGGVGSFSDSQMKASINIFSDYKRVLILVDNDESGVGLVAAIGLKQLILPKVPDIVIQLMDQDCNEILVERGVYGLKEEIKNMEL